MSFPTTVPHSHPEPNWYPDPQLAHTERYWDGSAWTTDVRPMTASPAAPQSRSNTLSIIAIVLGALATLFLPILLGPAGLMLAGIGKSKGESLSTVALVVAGVGMLVGFGLGILVGAAAA